MSTCKSSITILPNSSGELIQRAEQASVPLVTKRGSHGPVIGQKFERRPSGFGTSLRECWRRMTVMHAAFEHAESGDGGGSRERSEERLRDEEAWSGIDDEGGPDGRQPPYPRRNIVRMEVDAPRM